MASHGVEYAAEVGNLRRAVEGVRALLELRLEDAITSQDAWRATATSTRALLMLVTARLSMLERALRGSLDPIELLTEDNSVDPAERESLEGSHVSTRRPARRRRVLAPP